MAFIVIFIAAIYVWLGFRVLRKAGISGFWALTIVIPLINIAMVWVFALSRWPAVDKTPPPPAPPESSFTS